jgi:hypothetical protein
MAKTQSLAAQSGSVPGPELKLPGVFTNNAPAPVAPRNFPPYISFAHDKRADEWGRIKLKYPGITAGEMVLIATGIPEVGILKLDTFRLTWLCHRQYWSHSKENGELIATSYTEKGSPYKDCVEAVVLVYLEDRIIPANVCFKTTKTPAARTLSNALFEATQPAWGDKGPEYKETLICGQPFMRFYGEVKLGAPRTSKKTGLPYRPTECIIKPTGVADWRLMDAFSKDPAAQKLLDDAANNFQNRVKEVEAKLQK